MPLRRNNTRTFTRRTFAGMLESVKIYKRGPDQYQGTIATYILYNCRIGKIFRSGESMQGEMVVSTLCTWHIPRIELQRVGIQYISSLDRIEQLVGPGKGRFWQPEATTTIEHKLFENEIDVSCMACNPPDAYLQSVP